MSRPLPDAVAPRSRGLSLFWKVLFLVAAVSLVPLGVAMLLSINAATTVTEELLQKNLLQMSKQAAERSSYTLVSMDSDLDVMRELSPTADDFATFSHGQRRELYSTATDGTRQREDVPKYREVSFYLPDGSPLVVVVDDVPLKDPLPWRGSAGRWCEKEDFVSAAVAQPGRAVVAGLVGCHPEVESYSPVGGRLGERFSGGIRVSKAMVDEGGKVIGVASLILSQLHLVWALESLQRSDYGTDIVPIMIDRDGWILAHPDHRLTYGLDHAGSVVLGNELADGRSLQLTELAGATGEAFGSLLIETNSGGSANLVVHDFEDGPWVAAAYPVDGEIGSYSGSNPFGTVVVLYPREKALAVVSGLQVNLLILGGVTLLLVLLGSIFLAGNVTRPIRRLASAAQAIARGQSRPVPAHRKDELGDLARAFNRMERDLVESRVALIRSERLAAIGRFVSGIVHETKNVLAGLGNYVTLLERRADEDIRNRILPPMRRALEQMDTLVVRLRELSMEPRLEETDLSGVLRHAVELVENQARNAAIELDVSLPPELELPRADGAQLGQVFLNLLINAIEAVEKDGVVTLKATKEAGQLIVVVHDSGPGLPDVPSSELREPFFTTKTGGTGLGLYISSSIVERHEGSLILKNGVSGGAEAIVRLPLG
jgi:signal transduction histidine kinase